MLSEVTYDSTKRLSKQNNHNAKERKVTKEDEVRKIMEALVVATDKDVGEIMAARGRWAEGQSARVNSAKTLKKLADDGVLERIDGAFRLKGSRSEHRGHSIAVTSVLVGLMVWGAKYGD